MRGNNEAEELTLASTSRVDPSCLIGLIELLRKEKKAPQLAMFGRLQSSMVISLGIHVLY